MPYGLSKLSNLFPALSICTINKNSFEIEGDIYVHALLSTGYKVDDIFTIKIIAHNFPYTIPQCFEISHKISDFHINPTGELCLASPYTIWSFLCKNMDITSYIYKFIIPFLVSYKYYRDYGVVAFGELNHGGAGILQEYNGIFKTDNISTCELLTYGKRELYRGHHLCPCKSGLVLRDCHGIRLRYVFANYPFTLLMNDILCCYNFLKSKEPKEKLKHLLTRINHVIATSKKIKFCDKE